jgi:NADPH-dependent glutamate synthase beta subunit-like oxidoreductase
LSAAATLAKLGYAVDIFDEREEAGGYLRYGIPEYRLPNSLIPRHEELCFWLTKEGESI